MVEDDIKERFQFIESAIEKKQAIEIEYGSLNSNSKNYVLHPYQLILYNSAWFFFAWNTIQKREMYGYLSLIELKVLNC